MTEQKPYTTEKSDPGKIINILVWIAIIAAIFYYYEDFKTVYEGLEGTEMERVDERPDPTPRNMTDGPGLGSHPIYDRVGFYTEYLRTKDTDQAQANFMAIISGTEGDIARLRSELGEAYHQIGTIHLAAQEHKLARGALIEAVKLTQEQKGYDHPETGLAYHNLGLAYWGVEDFQSADLAFQHAETIYTKSYADDHSSVQALNESWGKMKISRQYVADDQAENSSDLAEKMQCFRF